MSPFFPKKVKTFFWLKDVNLEVRMRPFVKKGVIFLMLWIQGDCISVELSIGDSCTAAVTTQASTKVLLFC